MSTLRHYAKADVVAVFHSLAGHVILHDRAYNTERKISTGSPYKEFVADLMKRGVRVELSVATAAVYNWGNEDLLPDIKVNTNAMHANDSAFTRGIRANRRVGLKPPRLIYKFQG